MRLLCSVRYIHLVVVLLVAAGASYGQPSNSATGGRPTLGIALEGGGAKGLAHAGVLQWMEEHHIPIDYVAGTSMGGLIGGLYAIGLTPAEIREIVTGINWDEAVVGNTPYSALSFRRKEDFRAFPNRLELGLRHGLVLPAGLSSGQAVRVLIDRFMLPYSEPRSFDDLPVPFRCVATNLVTGKAEVFSSGSIATALRATMSLPGIFAPVRDHDNIYADGALLDNLPTDVVKQMGADVVIGAHLSVGPVKVEQLQTMLGVAGSATGVMIDANVIRGMELADLLLTIDVSAYTTLDFSQADQIIDQGYKAAEAKAAMLNRFRVDDATWAQFIARRNSRRIPAAPVVQFVEVEGIQKEFSGYVNKMLSHYAGKVVDTAALESDLNKIVGTGRFDLLTFSLTKRNNETGLLITAQEKDYAPPWFKPGFVIDGADPDNVGFTAAGRITFVDVGGYRSEIRTDFSFGSSYGLGAEYYRPFSPLSRWFVAPRAGASRTPLNLYSGTTHVADYRLNRVSGAIDIGYSFDRFSELRAGYEIGYGSATRQIGPALLPDASGRTGVARIRYAMDRLDNPIVPRHGIALVSQVGWIEANPGSNVSFPSGEMSLLGLKAISKPGSIYGVASGGSTFGNEKVGIPQFSMGGPARLAAYGINEFLTNQYVYGRVGYLHQIGQLPAFLGRGVYLDGHFEAARIYGSMHPEKIPLDGVAGIVTETLFGPLMIGGSVGGDGHRKWFFQLGKVF